MDRLDGHDELKKLDIVGAQRFFKRPKKRGQRRQNGAKRPKFTDAGRCLGSSRQYGGVS